MWKTKIPTYFKSTLLYSTSNFMLEYEISNQSDKNKDAMLKTTQYSARRQALYINKFGYGHGGYGGDDDDDDNFYSARVL